MIAFLVSNAMQKILKPISMAHILQRKSYFIRCRGTKGNVHNTYDEHQQGNKRENVSAYMNNH